MSNDAITVRKRQKWSAVPDDVLEHPRLSLRARAVLGWMLGRSDGWVIQIEHMLRVLRMTEYVWASVRNELQAAGYYRKAINVIRDHPENYDPGFEAVFQTLIDRLEPKADDDTD